MIYLARSSMQIKLMFLLLLIFQKTKVTAGLIRKSRVTGHGSWVTGHKSQVTGQGSWVTGLRSRVTGLKLQVACRRSQVAGYST